MDKREKPKLKTIIHKRKAVADRDLDVAYFLKLAVEEAIRLYPNAVSLEARPWPVITGSIIVARVKVEVEA